MIHLNDMERRLAIAVGKARTNSNRTAGVSDVKVGEQSGEATDLEGFAAELAFCKMFNLYPDLSVEPRSSKQDQGDAITHSGMIVDVKGSVYSTAHLLAVPWKEDTVDVYVLMVGQFPSYKFAGFARREELFAAENLSSRFNGYALPQEKLSTEGLK